MTESTKEQSNPFSTGGGGTNFETRVQAAFTVLMLTGCIAPCLPPYPITKLKLQGHYAGFATDDFIVFTKHIQTAKEAKLLAQIKHDIHITTNDETFAEVIKSAWNDFTGKEFNKGSDALVLITGPLSATDTNNVRPILEWARSCENEKEFVDKINTHNFSSDAKRTKLEVFKKQLKMANSEIEVSDKQLWEFLKAFHLIGYDLDAEAGSTLSLLYSLIAQYSKDELEAHLWARIVDFVQTANQNAGTLVLETLPEDIRGAFGNADSTDWPKDIRKLRDHGDYILGGIRTTVGGVHVKQPDAIAKLIDLTEASNFVFVTGQRGVGKSSLIRDFFESASNHAPVFYLRTEDLDESHLDKVFSTMGLKGSLSNIEAGFALMPKKYLVIESLEKILELDNTKAFADLLLLLNKQQGWTVIATGRDYAYQQISFNYLQPLGVNVGTLTLEGFEYGQVQQLCEQLEPLQKLSNNPILKSLLKSPFYADLAYRVLETGTEFAPGDGEKEFRAAVWRDVIAKEQERTGGLPLKRKKTFIDIAVQRAKRMVYGIPGGKFDSSAVLKLEEDNLIRRDSLKGLVSLSHDVFEDWALEQYIEDAHRQYTSNLQGFLDAIGNEPAINRAFRLWLHQKLRYGENVADLVRSVLTDQKIQRYWQDETIAAVLLGDNPDEFLELLKDLIFLSDGELLKRFCFILRITCQAPDQTSTPRLLENDQETLVDTLLLKPYGNGWNAIICFLYKNKDLLTEDFVPHVTAVLNDWASLLHIDKALPPPAREAGLLALHFLDRVKESHGNDKDRKKLLSVIIRSVPAIHAEFVELLEADVFISKTSKQRLRPRYADDLCEMAFSLVETAFLCKHDPDLLIKLANLEWFFDASNEDDQPWYSRSRIEVAECFGFHEFKYEFFPPSGSKGPFQYLLYYHSKKGLDFILNLLNRAADRYAHSDLDSPRDSADLKVGYSEPLIPQIEIHLNDGSSVKQYCSGRLWPAYRGDTVAPYLLQSALMALENWLIAYVEHSKSEDIEPLFDYILRNSNSVMPTAVLASVATGFSEKAAKSALPLLRTPELYFMDLSRALHEQGGHEINWFGGLNRDVFSDVYVEERRTAALRPWRREHLETLIMRLQLSELREDALACIDLMRSSTPESEAVRFLYHRIDSRGWKVVEDKENNRILFESKNIEPDLEKIQQKSQEELQLAGRFSSLFLWAKHNIGHEATEREYYSSWKDALIEAKNLFEKLKSNPANELARMHYGGIVTAAAVLVRDHSSELMAEDILWCTELIISTVAANADTDNQLAIADITDHDGAAAASSVLPILLDFVSKEDEKLIVRTLIATALTHANKNVRQGAANGVREDLWQRDHEFAQNCINGAIEYARFEKKSQAKRRRDLYLDNNAKEAERIELKVKRAKFRDRLARGGFSNKLSAISFQTHNSWHILVPCLMIPDGSKNPEHIELLSQMLALFFEAEKNKHEHHSGQDNNLEINYEIPLDFTKRFAKHLFSLDKTGFGVYIKQLQGGCDSAPDFINYLVLCIAVEAERTGERETFWRIWKELSQKVQGIAIEIAQQDSDHRRWDERTKLIRGMLHADTDWQKIDLENQDIAYGKDLVLEFVENAGKNPDVFEATTKLMYYFPSIFFDAGIHILSKYQKEEGGTRLLSEMNTAFYLERSIQRFLQLSQTGPLSQKMHESCFILLDAIVETSSSRAYYLREHLIRSRKIL